MIEWLGDLIESGRMAKPPGAEGLKLVSTRIIHLGYE